MNRVIYYLQLCVYVNRANDVRPIASMPFLGRYRLVDFPLSNMVNSDIDTVGIRHAFIAHLSIILALLKDWNGPAKSGGVYLFCLDRAVPHAGARFLLRDHCKPLILKTDACVLLSTFKFCFPTLMHRAA